MPEDSSSFVASVEEDSPFISETDFLAETYLFEIQLLEDYELMFRIT